MGVDLNPVYKEVAQRAVIPEIADTGTILVKVDSAGRLYEAKYPFDVFHEFIPELPNTLTKEIEAGTEEVFFTIDLTLTQNFEFTVRYTRGTKNCMMKVLVVYSEGVLDKVEYGIIGYDFKTTVNLEQDSGNFLFKVFNGGTEMVECSSKMEKL